MANVFKFFLGPRRPRESDRRCHRVLAGDKEALSGEKRGVLGLMEISSRDSGLQNFKFPGRFLSASVRTTSTPPI